MNAKVDAESFRAKYGPWAVICGASDGTGEAFAHHLAELGINLVLIARRKNLLDDLAAKLQRDYGIETVVGVIDLADEDASRQVMSAAKGLEVGLLVTNAGADTTGKSFLDAPMDNWKNLIQRNVIVLSELVYGFSSAMRERRRGGIIMMCSGTALGGQPGTAVYAGTKGYELNLAESLWCELRPFGIDVLVSLCPTMNTPTLQRVLAGKNLTIPGVYEPIDVVSALISSLSKGPTYMFPNAQDAENAKELEESRRDRVVAMENMVKMFFSD